jgi:hypothetical protein
MVPGGCLTSRFFLPSATLRQVLLFSMHDHEIMGGLVLPPTMAEKASHYYKKGGVSVEPEHHLVGSRDGINRLGCGVS